MINCRDATALHTLAEEGGLTGAKKALYALHMKICGPCQLYKKQLETSALVLKKLPPVEAPEALVDLLASELDKKE
jgi:hypothetical protein